MNFVGHAWVAMGLSDEPAYVLGSMLPDFAGMAGARLLPGSHGDSPLARGIALHHQTDDLFHGAPEFLTLMQGAMDELVGAGVGRGPARAIGHIGVEMLLDGALLERDDALAVTYERAVTSDVEVGPVLFRDGNGHTATRRLRERLAAHGAPYDYRNVEAVALRLERMLAPRPRLALAHDDRPRVIRALHAVQTRLPPILSPLLARLAEGTGGRRPAWPG